MRLIARYRVADDQGRHCLVNEYRDSRRKHWMELADGTEIVWSFDRTLMSATGESLSLIGRG